MGIAGFSFRYSRQKLDSFAASVTGTGTKYFAIRCSNGEKTHAYCQSLACIFCCNTSNCLRDKLLLQLKSHFPPDQWQKQEVNH